MYVEKKMKVNAEKVSYAKSFPGRLVSWEDAVGKVIKKVISINDEKQCIVMFEDSAFIFSPSLELQPALMIQLLLLGEPFLKAAHKDAYAELNRLIAEDRELQRMARMENIIGAIDNNLPQIPELKEALRIFLEKQGLD